MDLYCITAAGIYLLITAYTSWKITQSVILAKPQKIFNIFLNALIPILWFYLVYPILFPNGKIITRDERNKLLNQERGSRLEGSGTEG